MNEYIKIFALLKVAASIIFLWVHSPYKISYDLGNNKENLYNVERTSDIRFQRSLAKHALKKELNSSKIRDVISENSSNNSVKYTSDDLSEYAQLKKKGLNDLEIYKEQFKRKYAKRKGLKKLDCYCEKKIFDIIDIISEQKVGTNSNDIKLKKSIVRKWVIPTIVMSLIPLIGIIIPILKVKYHLFEIPNPVYDTYCIFFLILTWIILFLLIYIMKKVVKYHILEAGNGKMNRKLVSSVELKNLPDIKNEAQVERMGNKPREFSNKLEDSRSKNKASTFLILAFSVPYPLALYCIYLIVANSTRAPYSWITCGIAIPAFMGLVLLSVFLGTYYPKKRIKNIK